MSDENPGKRPRVKGHAKRKADLDRRIENNANTAAKLKMLRGSRTQEAVEIGVKDKTGVIIGKMRLSRAENNEVCLTAVEIWSLSVYYKADLYWLCDMHDRTGIVPPGPKDQSNYQKILWMVEKMGPDHAAARLMGLDDPPKPPIAAADPAREVKPGGTAKPKGPGRSRKA